MRFFRRVERSEPEGATTRPSGKTEGFESEVAGVVRTGKTKKRKEFKDSGFSAGWSEANEPVRI